MVDGEFRFIADPVYYLARFEDAWDQCRLAVERATFLVTGAEARLDAALRNETALLQYCARKADLLRLGAYRQLPTVIETTPDDALVYRQLLVGPFEGRFLVRADERVILGSLFLWHKGAVANGI